MFFYSDYLIIQLTCRGHIGGLFGGALAAYLLGPRFKVANIEGRRGQYLLDEPPIPLLASPPRLIK